MAEKATRPKKKAAQKKPREDESTRESSKERSELEPSEESETESSQEKNEVKEDKGGKDKDGKLSSYYYFKTTPKEQAAQYTPKPLTAGVESATVSAGGPSLWNSSGTTWEERDMSEWAQSRLRELLLNLVVPNFAHGNLKLTSVSKIEGDATIVFTRGKKKVGFELNIECLFTGLYKEAKAEVKLTIPSVDADDVDDFTVKLNVPEGSDKKTIKSQASSVTPLVRKKLKQLKDELQMQ